MFTTADVWSCDKASHHLTTILNVLKNNILYELNIPNKITNYTVLLDLPSNKHNITHVRLTVSPDFETFGYVECKYYYNETPIFINATNKRIFRSYPSLIIHIHALLSD